MSSDKWTEDIEKASDFKFGAEAIRFAFQHRLENVEIIYTFENPEYNIGTGTMNPSLVLRVT